MKVVILGFCRKNGQFLLGYCLLQYCIVVGKLLDFIGVIGVAAGICLSQLDS